MLKKTTRLSKEDIERYLLRAPRVRSAHFTLIYKGISGFTGVRAGVTVSKKLAPRATKRNLLRRRAYAALRPLIGTIRSGTLILISYGVSDTAVSIPALTEEIAGLLKKARL